jgi:hypothetical protein
MLNVVNKPFMPSVVMLNVIMLNVVMLTVVAPLVSPNVMKLVTDMYMPYQWRRLCCLRIQKMCCSVATLSLNDTQNYNMLDLSIFIDMLNVTFILQ